MSVGARNFSQCPDPSKNQYIAIFSKNSGETPQRCQSKKVAQRERGSDEPKNSRKLTSGAELRPKWFFLSVWSLKDRTGPQLTKWPLIPPQTPIYRAPRGTWEPTWDSLGPYSACDQIWSAGVSPRMAPKTGKINFFRVCGPFWALKTAKSFKCAWLYRGRQGLKTKKNRSVFDENTFFETATKSKISVFFDFSGVKVFLSVGARNFYKCPDPSKNQ